MEDVIACRNCDQLRVYRPGTLLCQACLDLFATGWPDEPTAPDPGAAEFPAFDSLPKP